MNARERTGADLLRLIVRNMDATREDFNDRFSADDLLRIYRAQLACGWDFTPDQWTAQQVADALLGIIPRWDNDEQPLPGRAPF